MPEKVEDKGWKNSTLRRRNSDPVCYGTTDEDADIGFMKLYEDTLQDLLQKARKEDKTVNDLQGFLNHQQNYVGKLLKEIKHLKEEKQRMSFELFAAKMEVEILKKQQLCIYEPGYITGLVQELRKASCERADILSSYCDKVQSLAYQKSQPFVPYQNQNYPSTFRPYQNGYQNYNNAYMTGPYANMNGPQPPRVCGSYSMPPYFAECDRPAFKGNYGMPSSSPLSSLSPASNSFGPSHPQISPQLSKEAHLFGYPLDLVNPDMNGSRPLQDMTTQQTPYQAQAPSQNGQSWGNHCIPSQSDPWRRRTESAPNQMLIQHEDQKTDTLPPAQKPIQQDKIKTLENEVDRLKEMYAQLYKLVPKDVEEVPKEDISQSTSALVSCNPSSFMNKPVASSQNACNETEDLPEGEKEALLLLDRALADHSGGSISSEEVFEESDKNSAFSGSPCLRSKPRNSPRCGVSSLIETKSKDFPFNFIRNRENKLVRSQSDSESVCNSSTVKPFNSYVKVLSKATDL